MTAQILSTSDILWFGEDYPDQQVTLSRTPSYLPGAFGGKSGKAEARRARIGLSDSPLCLQSLALCLAHSRC